MISEIQIKRMEWNSALKKSIEVIEKYSECFEGRAEKLLEAILIDLNRLRK